MWRLFALAILCLSAAVTASERSPAKVRIHHARSDQSELIASVETHDKTHNLKLKRTLVPSVRMQQLVIGANGSVTIEEVGENNTRNYYENEETGAFLFMNDENSLEGMVTDSVALHFDNNEHTVTELDAKSASPFCDVSSDSKILEELPKQEGNSRYQPEKKGPSFVVEILAAADSTLRNYKAQYFLEYMQVYWKMVDRRFRTVQGAYISIRLTSILTCSTTACDAVMMDARNLNYAELYPSKIKFAQFLARLRSQLAPFDVAHLMTKRNLYSVRSSGSWNTQVTGDVLAIGYPCFITSSYAYNSGLSEDDGLWIGTLDTAHMIGHNLGAHHDGYGTSTACPWNGGYLMSSLRYNYRTFWFSSCSSAAIINTYSLSRSQCLRTIQNSNFYTYPNYIAGNFRSLNTQCRWATHASNAIANPNVSPNDQCFRLRCLYVSGTTTVYYTSPYPALDGTPCPTGGFCNDGYCQLSWG